MIEIVSPDWPAPERVQAFCTTRLGGVSSPPYDSLNLGRHVGDDVEQVDENRRRLRAQLELDSEPEWINQTHSARPVILEQEQSRDADAAITREPGRVAVVMTADCLPILLCNRDGSEVAAVHAGWRGLEAGIVQNTMADMLSSPGSLLAWIGPAISQANYEVGEEVFDAFRRVIDDAEACFIPSRPGHWQCDLGGLAERVLENAGVEAVSRSPNCSFGDSERFFSYRREAVTGRMASLIWIR